MTEATWRGFKEFVQSLAQKEPQRIINNVPCGGWESCAVGEYLRSIGYEHKGHSFTDWANCAIPAAIFPTMNSTVYCPDNYDDMWELIKDH
jgi:hypothetical protein